MTSSYIVAAARTPQAKLLGSLSSLPAPALGAAAIEAVIKRCPEGPAGIWDQVIMGQVVSAGCGQAPARQAATLAQLPASVGAVTLNKVCGSGLYAVMLADMAIRAGQYQRVIAGGMESMSQAPHLMRGGRRGWKYGSTSLLDALEVDGLSCAQSGQAMGAIAQRLAQQFKISRAAQDAWAVRSHHRACQAIATGHFADELASVTATVSKPAVQVTRDEGPRDNCTLESLSALRPAFPLNDEKTGPSTSGSDGQFSASVTAGNASSLADGAAALAIVSQSAYDLLSPAWAFRIVDHTNLAAAHDQLFTAPAHAIQQLLKRTGRTLKDIDLVEINEAFAAQIIACNQLLNLDEEKVNVRGGAIALGHPLGCSGARVLVTLIHALIDHRLSTGIAALCLGGGEGVALLIERVN